MVGVELLTGLRRGELFGLRWQDVDLLEKVVSVEQAVYEGRFGSPKTRAGKRRLPLSDPAHVTAAECIGNKLFADCSQSGVEQPTKGS